MTEEFQNNPIQNKDLPTFENVELTPVSKKYLKVVMLNCAIFSLFLLIGSVVGFYFLQQVWAYAWLIFIIVTILILWIFAQNYFAFFQRKYAIRERDIIYHFGLLKRNLLIIPFNRIQHVALEEGWFSRILGLKSLSVFTASSSDLTINGLPKDVAENFNQLILNKIKEEELEEETIENLNKEILEKTPSTEIQQKKEDGE